MFLGILMLVIFLATVIFIMKGESPIISLLLLAIVWAILAGVPFKGDAGKDILSGVLDKGGTAYGATIVIIVFGAWFGQTLVKTGIVENIIRGAIELAGDRPVIVAFVVSIVTGLLFTSVYGVGAAIAIGVIALPIMMSMGIPPWVAAPAFTMAIGAGNYVNLVEYNIFKPMFPGISYEQPYLTFYFVGWGVYVLAACAMSFYQLKLRGTRKYSAVNVTAAPVRITIPWYAYLAPAVPVVLVIAFKWAMIPAFLTGTFYALAATHFGRRTFRETIDLFHKAFYDAFPEIATIAALWIICGMIIICGQLPQVQKVLSPVFTPILPGTPFTVALFFALLAPLAIYRGPFSIIGTGAALLTIFLNAKTVSPIYLYCVWRGAVCLQGSQDPTNSWTLWTIGYTKITHGQFLRTALPWGWLMVAVNAFIAYFMFG
jgi:Gnt-I system high-affinity gluconate transporter